MCNKPLYASVGEARTALIELAGAYLPYSTFSAFECDYGERYSAMSMDHPGRVSYAPKPEYRHDSARRVSTTFQRYLQRQLKIELTPDVLSGIERLIAVAGTELDERLFVIRDDVQSAYQFGPSSCMRNKDWTDWYDRHGVQIVTYYDSPEWAEAEADNYQGRALLWKTEQGTFLDRIYYNGAEGLKARRQFKAGLASARGWLCRSDSGSLESLVVKGIHGGAMPYMDTLRYMTHMGGTRFELSSDSRGGSVLLGSTDGATVDLCGECGSLAFLIGDDELCESCSEDNRRDAYHHELYGQVDGQEKEDAANEA